MKMKISKEDIKSIKVKVISGILIVCFLSAISYITSFYKSLFYGLENVWIFIISYISIPFYILFLIFLIFIYLLRFRIIAYIEENNTVKEYNNDEFYDIKWIWKIFFGEINNLQPICPNCAMDLVHREDKANETSKYKGRNIIQRPYEYATYFHCQNCGFKKEIYGSFKNISDIVQKLIIRKSRTGEWNK